MPPTLNDVLHRLLRNLRPRPDRPAARRLEDGGVRAESARSVGDLMMPHPRTCRLDDSLHRAAQIMWEADCGCVPVVDDDGKVVAMITDRDVCMAAYTQGLPLWQLPVASAASREVVAIGAGDSIESALRLMQHHRVRRLPVVDAAGRAVGVLSLNDLARHSRFGHRLGALGPERVAATLAEIGQPDRRAATAAE